jgi:hypothetical protein
MALHGPEGEYANPNHPAVTNLLCLRHEAGAPLRSQPLWPAMFRSG